VPQNILHIATQREREINLLSKPVFQCIPSKFTQEFTGYIIFTVS